MNSLLEPEPKLQPEYFQAKTVELRAEPTRESGVVITRQDFALLLEGSRANSLAARRDLFVGIAVSCLTGALGVAVSSDFFVFTGSPPAAAPNWWAWLTSFVLAAGTLASGVVAGLAHKDARQAGGGTAYELCVEAIKATLKGDNS